jgi:hypothetical protein
MDIACFRPLARSPGGVWKDPARGGVGASAISGGLPMFSDARIRTTDYRTRRSAARALALTLTVVIMGLALLTTSAPCRAAALTTSETQSIPLTPTNWGPGAPATITDPLNFKQFDPTLGTLDSVQVSLGYKFTHDISFTFHSPSTITLSTMGSQVLVNSPTGSLYLKGAPDPLTQSHSDSTGPYDKAVTIPTITQTGSSGPLTLTSAADLALFTATTAGGKIGLPVLAQSGSSFSSSSGNGGGRISTNAGADVTVSYTYTPAPVPEPSTLAVLGLGGAVLFACRRRAAVR